ncbi:unnamed protein product, partial [marine sediment metagenome]
MDLQHLYTGQTRHKLSFDPQIDRPADGEGSSSMMQISLSYPMLHLQERSGRRPEGPPSSLSAQSPSDSLEEAVSALPARPQTEPSSAPEQPFEAEKPQLASADDPAGTPQVMQEHLRIMEAFLKTHEQVMSAYLNRADTLEGTDMTAATQTDVRGQASPTPPSPSAPPPDDPVEPHPGTAQSAEADAPSARAEIEPTLPSSDAGARSLVEVLIDIVSDKTGYPPDMLDLDLNMEAD